MKAVKEILAGSAVGLFLIIPILANMNYKLLSCIFIGVEFMAIALYFMLDTRDGQRKRRRDKFFENEMKRRCR